jgi:hypothetical protein
MLFFVRHAYQEYWRLVRLYEMEYGEGTYFEHLLEDIHLKPIGYVETAKRKESKRDTPTWAPTEIAFLLQSVPGIAINSYYHC